MGIKQLEQTTTERIRGRTIIELNQQQDGTWVATQLGIDIEGCGESGALAAMDYCRKVADRDSQ